MGQGLHPNQREKMLVEWNNTRSDYPYLCIHELFSRQAGKTPDATAVVYEGRSLSYRELDHRSTIFAQYLRACGVKPGTLVGLCVNRSAEMVVALLGILKAGGAYVPLDPAYPKQRLQFILEDSQITVLVSEESLLELLPACSARIVLLHSDWMSTDITEQPHSDARPSDLAYVIYTSGSTGKPKGVQIEHRSVVNLLTSMASAPGLSSGETLLAVTTLSFDIAGLEIYLPLIVGARLLISSREVAADGLRLQSILEEFGVTVMQATPATWRLLLAAGWTGNPRLKVLVGGEALSVELARKLASCCASVWNLYGPTETTIWSAVYRVTGEEEGTVPIGRPIANTEFYIVDGERQPVPVGSEGELCIGGDGLARGYLNRPELTAEKFILHPFIPSPDARVYRTGDLARYRADGTVEFLGRIDHQVKIRGFRIELGEIESVLERHADVQQAVVVAQEDSLGDRRLIAYFVSSNGRRHSVADLRTHLRVHLPDYMIPAAFVKLEQLPQTPNGKIDRRALPAPSAEDLQLSSDFVAPRDAVESKLVNLWERLLGVKPIGVKTNFFELGVHSLQAAQLFFQISKAFGKDLPISLLFKAPTIEGLAEYVREQGNKANFATLIPIQPVGSKPVFFCVHGGAGSTLFLHGLAHHLGPDQPFYGFESEGMDGRRIQHTTMEKIAARYIHEMRQVQSEGPYYIGGYCFGGLVAFEMAQQLRRMGERVAIVAMLNAPLRFHRLAPSPARTAPRAEFSRFRKLHQLGPRQKVRYIHDGLRGILRRKITGKIMRKIWVTRLRIEDLICRCFLAAGRTVPGKLRRMYIHRMTGAAERAYRPTSYPGRLTLFRGKGLYDNDQEMGWSGLADHLEIHEIAGREHRSRRDILNEPVVGLLARRLATCLEEASLQNSGTDRSPTMSIRHGNAADELEEQDLEVRGLQGSKLGHVG
jgi:amino acid adenylation domain-containing protein